MCVWGKSAGETGLQPLIVITDIVTGIWASKEWEMGNVMNCEQPFLQNVKYPLPVTISVALDCTCGHVVSAGIFAAALITGNYNILLM